jgi:hypothetical protein
MPEPVVIEYRRALDLKGFSKTVKAKARSRRSGAVKVSYHQTFASGWSGTAIDVGVDAVGIGIAALFVRSGRCVWAKAT